MLDANIPAVLFVSGLLLISPPIWKQIEPLFAEKHRERTKMWVEGFVVTSVLGLLGFGMFGVFPMP